MYRRRSWRRMLGRAVEEARYLGLLVGAALLIIVLGGLLRLAVDSLHHGGTQPVPVPTTQGSSTHG
jgi:hypothetical protein